MEQQSKSFTKTKTSKSESSPFNRVVLIKSLLMLKNGNTIEVQGVGAVIHDIFVVTCAHNIFYKWNKYSPRKEGMRGKNLRSRQRVAAYHPNSVDYFQTVLGNFRQKLRLCAH